MGELVGDDADAFRKAHGREEIASQKQSLGRRHRDADTRAIPGLVPDLCAVAHETFGKRGLVHVDANGGRLRKRQVEAVAEQPGHDLCDVKLVEIRTQRRRRRLVENH